MHYELYLDYTAILIFVMCLLYSLFSTKRRTTTGKFFVYFASLSILATIFDILSVNKNTGYTWLWITNTAYLFFRNICSSIFCFYLISLTDTWHKIRKSKLLLTLLLIPNLIIVGALFTNFFNHDVFVITKDLEYIRNYFFSFYTYHHLVIFFLVLFILLFIEKYFQLINY